MCLFCTQVSAMVTADVQLQWYSCSMCTAPYLKRHMSTGGVLCVDSGSGGGGGGSSSSCSSNGTYSSGTSGGNGGGRRSSRGILLLLLVVVVVVVVTYTITAS